MIRRYYTTGLTANALISPPPGYKWKVLSALAWITSGSSSGSRTIVIAYRPGNQASSPYMELVLTPSETSTLTSSTVLTGGSPANTAQVDGPSAGSAVQWSECPILSHFDSLSIEVTLITGDSYSYIIMVEEDVA